MEQQQQQLASLLEYGGSVVEKVQREFMPKLFERIEAFATSIGQHDKESSEEFKLTTVQLWGGLFLLWLFLPVPVFGIVKGMLGLVFIPFMPIIWVLRLVRFVLCLIVKSILWSVLGFQPGGVKKGSVAANSQSPYYGPYTRGAFSSMQAMGATDVKL